MSSEFYVQKADGSRQPFDREKVIKTCLKFGANRQIADEIADKIEQRIHDGIETKNVFRMIQRMLQKYKPILRHLVDLRKSLSLLRPRDFERYIQSLLQAHGYEVVPNPIVRGKCVEHEVDAIARNEQVTYIVEIKHHVKYHTPTGLDESRIARAILEDIAEGYAQGLNTLDIDHAMIVCNTKFSRHATKYGNCRGILQVGWSAPPYRGLQDLIEEKQLHPITCIKGLERDVRERLITAGILFLKQLVKTSSRDLAHRIGVSEETVESIYESAHVLECYQGLHMTSNNQS